MKTALIVAPELDVHAFAVKKACNEIELNAIIIDPATYGSAFELTTSIDSDKSVFTIDFLSGKILESNNITGIWWRRPFETKVKNSEHPSVHKVIEREKNQAFFGTLTSIVVNQFNSLSHSRNASLKIVQLNLARKIGLIIPRTLVSNSAEQVIRWCSKDQNVIFKMFDGVRFSIFETRKLLTEHLSEIWRVKQCPVIFQEYISGECDIRATVVGEKLFVAELAYDKNSLIVDTRLTQSEARAGSLPEEVVEKIIMLVKTLGLRYAALDLRRLSDGSVIFFEINPEGQYLWTEIEADLPISREIAKQLR